MLLLSLLRVLRCRVGMIAIDGCDIARCRCAGCGRASLSSRRTPCR